GDDEIQIAATAGAAAAFAGDAHPLPRPHARGNLHVHLAANALPAGAVAGRARLPVDIAAALASRARLVDSNHTRLALSVERFFQRDLDARLDVLTAPSAARTAEASSKEVLESARPCARTGPRAGSEIAEDRAEELGKVAGVAILDREAT